MNVDLPERFQPLFKPKRFKVFFGGRGGAKTVSFSKALILRALSEKTRVLCLREFMSSIKESVHSSLSKEVETLQLQQYFNVQEKEIKGVNDSLFIYRGVNRNPTAIKSFDDFDVAWLEEAESFTEKSLKKYIIPTIRKTGSEIWISFNPEDEFDAVYSTFVKPNIDTIRAKGFYEDETLYVARVNLDDNPFATEELLEDSRQMKVKNPRGWLHVYGGECYADYQDSIIKPEWFDAAIDAHVKLGFKPLGIKSVGFDLADTGDAKSLTLRHGCVITKTKRWEFGELPEAIDIAYEFAIENRADFIVYDDDGLGKSVKVYLDKTMPVVGLETIAYNGNGRIDNPGEYYDDDFGRIGKARKLNRDLFKNKRSQKYWDLRDRFEATYNAVENKIYTDPEKLISICSDIEDIDVLKSELIKIKRVRGNNNFIQIQSKKDAMKEGIKSPNMADSLKMCFANPPPFEEIEPLTFMSEF